MSKIKLEVISQEKPILSAEVDEVIAPSVSGEVTVLPNHIPLFTKLQDGILIVRTEGKEQDLAVIGGFMDVGPDSKVTILADAAVRAEEINIAQAEQARQAAEDAMQNKESEVQFREAEASLRRALLELRVANRRRPQSQLPKQE